MRGVLAHSWLSLVSIIMASLAGQFRVTHAVVVFFSRYTPKTIEIEHKLQPFIPDFIPAVGDIDAFLKVQSLQVPLYVLLHKLKQNVASVQEGQLGCTDQRWLVCPCSGAYPCPAVSEVMF